MFVKGLFTVQHFIQRIIPHKQTCNKRNPRKRDKENPNSPQTIRIQPLYRLQNLRRQLLEIQNCPFGFISRNLKRHRNRVTRDIFRKILVPLILEDDPTESNTKGLSERSNEDEGTGRDPNILVRLTSLCCELKRGEENPRAETDENHVSNALWGGGIGGEESKETASDEGDGPAKPDGRTEAQRKGHDDTGDCSRGGSRKCDGKSIHTSLQSRVNKNRLSLVIRIT
jgi:hypothetical protein